MLIILQFSIKFKQFLSSILLFFLCFILSLKLRKTWKQIKVNIQAVFHSNDFLTWLCRTKAELLILKIYILFIKLLIFKLNNEKNELLLIEFVVSFSLSPYLQWRENEQKYKTGYSHCFYLFIMIILFCVRKKKYGIRLFHLNKILTWIFFFFLLLLYYSCCWCWLWFCCCSKS